MSVGLEDSPVGAMAWIVEKYWFWSDKSERDFFDIFTPDQLLDEVMMYVATDTLRTSMWPYMAFQFEPPVLAKGQKIEVPYGVQQWVDPIHPQRPREFVERSSTNIVQFTNMEKGGHFPFYEQPENYVQDILKFGKQLDK